MSGAGTVGAAGVPHPGRVQPSAILNAEQQPGRGVGGARVSRADRAIAARRVAPRERRRRQLGAQQRQRRRPAPRRGMAEQRPRRRRAPERARLQRPACEFRRWPLAAKAGTTPCLVQRWQRLLAQACSAGNAALHGGAAMRRARGARAAACACRCVFVAPFADVCRLLQTRGIAASQGVRRDPD